MLFEVPACVDVNRVCESKKVVLVISSPLNTLRKVEGREGRMQVFKLGD